MKTPSRLLPAVLAALFAFAAAVLPATAGDAASPAPTSPVPACAAVSVSVTPERGVLSSGRPGSAFVKVALSGAALPAGERPAVNLALVLDRSGSMQGDRIARAREAAIAAVERLDERDFVSVIVFDDTVDILAGAQTASAANKAAIVEKLRSVGARGSTAIFAAVSVGASELRKNLSRGLVNRLVLLSDGEANVGPSTPGDFGRLGASLAKEGVSVSTLGVGLGYNENLMATLAARSDGNTYFIEGEADLPRILGAELGDAFEVAARDVSVTVRFRDASPVELVGRDGRIEDGVVTVDFSQIHSRQEKFVLVRTEFPSGADGERRTFAVAEASWTLPGSGEKGRATASADISFSRDDRTVEQSLAPEVFAQRVRHENSVRTREALSLSAAGDAESARRLWSLNLSNASLARETLAGLDRHDATAAEAAASVDADIEWELSNRENYVAPGVRARKSVLTRSVQIETQQTVVQPGL